MLFKTSRPTQPWNNVSILLWFFGGLQGTTKEEQRPGSAGPPAAIARQLHGFWTFCWDIGSFTREFHYLVFLTTVFFWCKTKIVEAKGRYLSNKSLRHKRDPTKTTSFWGSRLGRKGLFWIDLQIDLRSMMIINSNDTLSKRLSPWGTSKRNMVLLTTEFFPMSLSCSYVNWLLIFDCSMATRRTWHVCLQKKGSLKRKFSWYGSNFESVYHELWYISTWMSEGI